MADSPESPRTHGGDSDLTTAISAAVVVLAVVAVALRFWTRHFTNVGFGWDDWLILMSVVTTVLSGLLVMLAMSVDPDGAWVTENTDPTYHYTDANIQHLKLSFIASVLYFSVAATTKLSILAMYDRIFSVSTAFRYQVFVLGVLVAGYWCACTVATLVNCRPLEWSWLNSLSDPRYCFNYNIFWMATGIVEAVLDVLIIALPIRIVGGLKMQRRKRYSTAAVFLVGVFVIVSGILKVVLGYVPGSRVPSYQRTEIWTSVHVGIGIVCACLPVCWPLVNRLSKLRVFAKLGTMSPRQKWYTSQGWSSMGGAGNRGQGCAPSQYPSQHPDAASELEDVEQKKYTTRAVDIELALVRPKSKDPRVDTGPIHHRQEKKAPERTRWKTADHGK